MNQEELRKILRAEKQRQNRTWGWITRHSGVAYSTICNFAIGERDTSLNVIIRLLDVLGLELCVRRKKDETKNLRPMQKNH